MIVYSRKPIVIAIYRCARRLSATRLSVAMAVAVAVGPGSLPCKASWKDDIGFNLLQSRLGSAMPTGAGIKVAQVETSVGMGINYLPDSTDAQFLDKSISPLSEGTGVSIHATTVGKYYFGLITSVGPGISLINAYESNDWCGQGFLNYNSGLSPALETARTENHSWISSFGLDLVDNDVLRRMDLVVQRDGVLVAAGVNNGAATRMPRLMCSGHNTLAVGLSNGQSSFGPTLIGPAGRVKPDLVVPLSAASWATPVVASCGSLLIETIQAGAYLNGLPPQQAQSALPLLTKALLMGGATKTAWPDWRRGFAEPSTDGTVPLDYRYGAGQLNIDNSHRILTAGQQRASSSSDVGWTGWDYGSVAPAARRQYFFSIPTFSRADNVSILVTWHRQITVGAGTPLILTPSLANINLHLKEAIGFSTGALVDQSVSMIDNVEHIFLRSLAPGRYVFEVTTDTTWDYAIAWNIHLVPTGAADLNGDDRVDAADLAIFQACSSGPNVPYNTASLPANCTLVPDANGRIAADFDTDGDVDQADFGVLQRGLAEPD